MLYVVADYDFQQDLAEAKSKYETISKAVDLDRLREVIKDLEAQASAPGLWDNTEHAQQVTSRLSAAQGQLKRLEDVVSRIDDAQALYALGVEESDEETKAEAANEIQSVRKDLKSLEIQTLLDGEYDETGKLPKGK